MMAKIKYRALAQSALERAKNLIKSNNYSQFLYAALELRQALEALTYEVAFMLKDEIPIEEYAHWQPRKLINALKEIDPNLFIGMTISFEVPVDKSEPDGAKEWKILGKNNSLKFEDVKKHYDALGFYLHAPTIDCILRDKLPKIDSLRDRCEEVIEVLDNVFASTLFNVNASHTSTLPKCANPDCGKPVRARMPFGTHTRSVRCLECLVEYKISTEGDSYRWESKNLNVRCPNKGCEEVHILWKRDLIQGQSWRCANCKGKTSIEFCVLCERNDGNGIYADALKVPNW